MFYETQEEKRKKKTQGNVIVNLGMIMTSRDGDRSILWPRVNERIAT